MGKISTLKSSRDFQKVYDKGKSFANRYLVIFFLNNELNHNRVGFVTTKKLGNAVKRNKYKRRLKEAYRNTQNDILKGYDIIILFRKKIPEIDYSDIKSALNHIVSIAKLKGKNKN